MFELKQLRQFVVLAQELNFGRAAEKLHMSQPPLSVAIRKLEERVGTPLVDRSRHHVRLTPAGKVFLKEAQRLLLQAHAATERALRAAQGVEGSLSLSFVPSAAIDVLPDMFRRFQNDYPTVQLNVTAESTSRQLEALKRAQVDLALVVGPLRKVDGLASVDLQTQGFVVAVFRGHALASQRSVRLAMLKDEPFIAFPESEGAGFAAASLSAFNAAGFSPRVVQEASQMQAVLTLVAGGLGIAMVPASMRTLAMKDVVFLDLAKTRPPPSYQLTFAYSRHNDNPVIHAFLAVAARTSAR